MDNGIKISRIKFTEKEKAILNSGSKVKITLETFLRIYQKANLRLDTEAIRYLQYHYPEFIELMKNDKIISLYGDNADLEYQYLYAVFVNTRRYTKRRILEMVTYLIGGDCSQPGYAQRLDANVSSRKMFNYRTCQYYLCYDEESLWSDFFMSETELKTAIQKRAIQTLYELTEQTYLYFDRCCQKSGFV